MYIYIYMYLCISLSFYMSIYLGSYVSLYLSVYLVIYLCTSVPPVQEAQKLRTARVKAEALSLNEGVVGRDAAPRRWLFRGVHLSACGG